MLRDTRRKVPLLVTDAAAVQIQICVRAARRLDGAMAEAGVLQGGSARLICEAKGDAELHLFDVFDTLQAAAGPSTGLAGEVRDHFGTVHGSLDAVRRLLASYPNVHIHPGLFPDSVSGEIDSARFAFVHLDMDLAESTRAGLDFFHPRLVRGGILLGDDYFDAAVRGTFADFFRGRDDTVIELPWGQVMVVKQG